MTRYKKSFEDPWDCQWLLQKYEEEIINPAKKEKKIIALIEEGETWEDIEHEFWKQYVD